MESVKESFLKNRMKSIGFSLKGIRILILSESSIKIQVVVAVVITLIGLIAHLTLLEWMIQFTVIGMVLVAEALNTAIEKVADFIHPDYDEKIGRIKDIAAGSAGLAAMVSLIVGGIIYIPKILDLF